MTDRLKLGSRRGLALIRPGDTPPRRDHLLSVDGAKAPMMPVDLPEKLRGAARMRVARQQIADRLGVAPASLAVLPGEGGPTWSRVIVVARDSLRAWSDTADRRCRAVVPDYMTLPQGGDRAVIACDGANIIARLGADTGLTAPIGVAEAILARAFLAAGIRSAAVDETVPSSLSDTLTEAGIEVRPATIDLSRAPKPTLDLRTALRDEGRADGLGVWLLAAGIATVAFGLWAAGLVWEARVIEAELAEVRAETEEVLRAGLIPSGPLLDVRAQVTRVIAQNAGVEGRDDLAGLALFSRVSGIVFERGIAVDTVELDESALRLSVTAPDFDAAEALEQDFTEEGIAAATEVLRARDDGQVEARFRLERGT